MGGTAGEEGWESPGFTRPPRSCCRAGYSRPAARGEGRGEAAGGPAAACAGIQPLFSSVVWENPCGLSLEGWVVRRDGGRRADGGREYGFVSPFHVHLPTRFPCALLGLLGLAHPLSCCGSSLEPSTGSERGRRSISVRGVPVSRAAGTVSAVGSICSEMHWAWLCSALVSSVEQLFP